MPTPIRIVAGDATVRGELNDSPTAQALAAALPIQGTGQRWGEEIYFSVPVQAELEADARDVMAMGELGYWPPGSAFCLFFGPTPASQGDEIRAASPVNVIGHMSGDLSQLSEVPTGTPVTVERQPR